MRNSKPALSIRAGQFNNDIDNYAIRVGYKDEDGKTIHNIMIYDHSDGLGNRKVVLANEGEMLPSADKQFLIFRLKDGWRYEEAANNGSNANHTQIRMHFRRWDKFFDLSGFKMTRTNENLFKNAYQMMNVSQLSENIDSIKRSYTKLTNNINAFVGPYLTMLAEKKDKKPLLTALANMTVHLKKYDSTILQIIPDTFRVRTLQTTINQVRNSKSLLDATASDYKLQEENYKKYKIEWHRKFTLSFACVLLFLIGAPLGAIVRKGGIGMPLVIAVGFFVLFHIISMTGEKLAQAGALPPVAGMWMATTLLLPLAFVLINQARNDSQIFTKEWYIRTWNKIKNVFTTQKNQ
jgi:lipopolysaccharide export system permease protein